MNVIHNSFYQEKNIKLKVYELAILLGVIFSVFSVTIGFNQQCEEIEEKILRLHVLSNSDSKEDQELKLKVRDKVIDYSSNVVIDSKNRDEAEKAIKENLKDIEHVAYQEVLNNGYNYKVKAELVNMYFDTREYKNVTLPAGYYNAVRISIGKAEGKNWWCVMFPPMCVPAASDTLELSEILEKEQMDLVSGKDKYIIKFKIIEILQRLQKSKETIVLADTENSEKIN